MISWKLALVGSRRRDRPEVEPRRDVPRVRHLPRHIGRHGLVDERGIDERGVDERRVDEGGVDERRVDERGVDERGVDEGGIDERGVDEGGIDERRVDERRILVDRVGVTHHQRVRHQRRVQFDRRHAPVDRGRRRAVRVDQRAPAQPPGQRRASRIDLGDRDDHRHRLGGRDEDGSGDGGQRPDVRRQRGQRLAGVEPGRSARRHARSRRKLRVTVVPFFTNTAKARRVGPDVVDTIRELPSTPTISPRLRRAV